MRRASRSQSAMEYLMTYGWAILIIAVVLGALFQLGVFNASSFAPKAPPGSCQVFRPNGPGTSQNINLLGLCTSQLPQYVAQFNGATGYVGAANSVLFNPTTAISVNVWIKRASDIHTATFAGSGAFNLANRDCGGNCGIYGGVFVGGGWQGVYAGNTVNLNTWYFLTLTYDSSTRIISAYLNGAPDLTSTLSGLPSYTVDTSGAFSNNLAVGGHGGQWGTYFNGQVANLQVYNVSLTANQVQAQYLKGIGGSPSPVQNLVGWWPLNGDTKDYSGNNNNGQGATGFSFTSQWTK